MEGRTPRDCLWQVRRNIMSGKTAAVTLGIIALCIAAGYAYWEHSRNLRVSVQPHLDSIAPPVPNSLASAGVKEARVIAANSRTPVEGADSKPAVLRSGEVLQFVADVAKLSNVANLRLQTLEQRNFYGKSAWHLQALAHTENPLRMVFELDDQFDSYSETSSLSTLQYEMRLNERGQRMESVQRMTTSRSTSGSATPPETHVLPGTRDPLGFMQFLRTVDWSHTPEIRGPVYDGHKSYDVVASFQGKDPNVAVPAGNFAILKIEIRVFDQGAELKDAHFVVYLADSPPRTPVLLEAVMPFATARVALAKVQ
jgi:hypothetical protein